MVPTVPQLSLARQKYSDDCEAAINEQIKFSLSLSSLRFLFACYFFPRLFTLVEFLVPHFGVCGNGTILGFLVFNFNRIFTFFRADLPRMCLCSRDLGDGADMRLGLCLF